MRVTGTVKFFDAEKGWGFLRSDAVRSDIFVHHRSIRMSGYRELMQGQKCEFDIETGRKGLAAADVVPLDA